MAAIGGLSSSVTNSASSIRGYGGLASGLDRDSLIESMTAGTTSKIYKQQQAKQKLEWKQTALRGITEKLYQFSQKYMSYTSKENLLGSTLFSPGKVNTLGKYSDLVSVTGSSAMAGSMSIEGVKQLAAKASATSKGQVSAQKLEGNSVGWNLDNAGDSVSVNVLGGSSLTFSYGSKSYQVYLPEDGYNYDDPAEVAKALNEAMKKVDIGGGKTLGSVIQATAATVGSDTKLEFKITGDDAGNTIKLKEGSGDVLKRLGFGEDQDLTITKDKGLQAVNKMDPKDEKTLAQWLDGQEISFTYNGKTEKIKLSADELKSKTLRECLQNGLDKAFGNGRIKVDTNGGKQLSFTTTIPGKDGKPGAADNSSVLAINSSGKNILGEKGVLGIMAGSSNRLNLESSVEKSGLKAWAEYKGKLPEQSDLKINGVLIEGITKDSSIKEIIEKINNTEGVGVKISYQSNADKFVITSTMDGASGRVNIEGEWGTALFGVTKDSNGTTDMSSAFTVQEGKDAIISVKYPGSDEAVEIVRGSNTFDLNGMNVTVKGTFGDYTSGKVNNPDPVTFESVMETDKTVETVKGMVDAFNEILELVNKEVSTKPNRKYAPLTGPQEDEMSESEIEKWNEKASEGMLFNDADLRGLANSLRFLVSGNSELRDMGISVSNNYSDNGKIVFDEEKFKKALEADPEKVRKAFTAQAEKDASGNVVQQGGLMVRLQEINQKYASMTGSTKGILVERAGSPFAPTTILKNELQKQMDSIDKVIDGLQDKLKIEQDRYISQFTSLEMLINQMNSQSSWLASAFGS